MLVGELRAHGWVGACQVAGWGDVRVVEQGLGVKFSSQAEFGALCLTGKQLTSRDWMGGNSEKGGRVVCVCSN